jgi:formylglycine-generating enzyme required for sulfatase activity
VPTCQASAADTIPIPAGAFYKNANPADGVDTTDQLVTLPAFAIDRTEVTRAAFAVYAAMEPLTGDGAARADSSAPPAEADKRLPVVGINFYTARDYCRYLGKDLPTAEQWQKAFRGGIELDGKPNPAPMRVTPWLHPTSPHPTNIAYTDTSEAAPVGSFPDDTSPYGVVDLAGNVAEWSLSRPVPRSLHGLRTVLGAAWDSPPDLKQHEITRRNSRHDRFLDFGIGLRCVVILLGAVQ